MGGDDENGPKRRETRRLGQMYVFFFLSCFLTNILCSIYAMSML